MVEYHAAAPAVEQSAKRNRAEKRMGILAAECFARMIRVSNGEDWQNPGSGSWTGSVTVDLEHVKSVMTAKREEEWKC